MDARVLEILSRSPAETQQIGMTIGEAVQAGDVLCLSGELGAGKTTLAAGIGRGWGAAEVVNSPTFVFMNEYSRADGGRLYHVDAYRLRDSAEADSIALGDALDAVRGGPARCALMIEWPERVADYLPPDCLWISLHWIDDDQRRLKIEAKGERHEALLQSLLTGAGVVRPVS